MKLLSTLIFGVLLTTSIFAQEGKKAIDPEFKSLLKFEEKSIDLGDVVKGESKESAFYFTNVSEENVTIEFISVCDCTEVDFPTLPIKPGESGKIDVIFNSEEKDKSEEIVLDILLENIEPGTGYQIVEQVNYTYNLIIKE